MNCTAARAQRQPFIIMTALTRTCWNQPLRRKRSESCGASEESIITLTMPYYVAKEVFFENKTFGIDLL